MDTQARFEPIEDEAGLDEAIRASREGPVVVFLDDPYCPISAMAHEEMERVPATVRRVDVSWQHDLSSAVERRSGVRHESPQVLVFRDGRVAWSASHGRITAAAVAAVLDERPDIRVGGA